MADFKVDARDYRRLSDKLKTVDKKVARAMRKRLREAAGPIGRYVLEYGVEQMPRRGGLRARLAGSPVAASVRASGVDVWLGSRKKSQLSLLNRGLLRHPVYADVLRETRKDWRWATQHVPDEAFSEALQHLPPERLRHLEATITDLMKELKL